MQFLFIDLKKRCFTSSFYHKLDLDFFNVGFICKMCMPPELKRSCGSNVMPFLLKKNSEMRKRKNKRIFNACFIAKLFKTFLSSGDLIYNSCFASMHVLSSVSMSLSKTRKIQRFNV